MHLEYVYSHEKSWTNSVQKVTITVKSEKRDPLGRDSSHKRNKKIFKQKHPKQKYKRSCVKTGVKHLSATTMLK